MKRILTLLILIGSLSAGTKASTCTAIASGNWEAPTTWSCGAMPTCGDNVIIPATFTVTVSAIDNYVCVGAMTVTISGELDFVTGKKLQLPCGSSVVLLAGGEINPGGGGGSSNLISICGVNVWTAGQGPLFGPMVLPVQLLSFDAAYNSPVVDFSWSTATEVNNKLFTIDRSTDGINWETVITKPGAINSTTNQYYSASDENPEPGVSYYRLSQTDLDGKLTYLAMVPVNIPAEYVVKAFPNPVAGNTTLSYFTQSPDPVNVTISDLFGKTISQYSFEQVQKGTNNLELNTSSLSPGIYFVHLSNPQKSFNLKIVKQ